MEERILFTSESVSEGHPDKVCDQIADAILDACLKQDKDAHVACEVFVTTNYVLVGGEISPLPMFDVEALVRKVIREIGYDKPEYNFSDKTVKVDLKIKGQSPDIAQAVTRIKPEDIGAGDQGIMFGYASNETKGYMPLAIVIAHKIMRVASEKRKNGEFKFARPDMKEWAWRNQTVFLIIRLLDFTGLVDLQILNYCGYGHDTKKPKGNVWYGLS